MRSLRDLLKLSWLRTVHGQLDAIKYQQKKNNERFRFDTTYLISSTIQSAKSQFSKGRKLRGKYVDFNLTCSESSRGSAVVVSWCCGRAQSPNDVIQQTEKTLNNTHTTTQKRQQQSPQNQETPANPASYVASPDPCTRSAHTSGQGSVTKPLERLRDVRSKTIVFPRAFAMLF